MLEHRDTNANPTIPRRTHPPNPHAVGEDLVRFCVNEFHRNGMHVMLTTNPAGPWVNHRAYRTRDEAFYNRRRLHSSLDYFSPEEYEQLYHQQSVA